MTLRFLVASEPPAWPHLLSLGQPVRVLGRAVKEGRVEMPSPIWLRRKPGSGRGLAWPSVMLSRRQGTDWLGFSPDQLPSPHTFRGKQERWALMGQDENSQEHKP